MNPVRYTVVLDVKKSGSQQKLQGFYKGENKAREIEITLIKDSNILSVGDECTLVVYGEKNDSSTFMQSCEVIDGKIMFIPLASVFSESGSVDCQIQMIDVDGKIMYSPSFTLEVGDGVRNDEAVESSEELSYLDELIRKAESQSPGVPVYESCSDLPTDEKDDTLCYVKKSSDTEYEPLYLPAAEHKEDSLKLPNEKVRVSENVPEYDEETLRAYIEDVVSGGYDFELNSDVKSGSEQLNATVSMCYSSLGKYPFGDYDGDIPLIPTVTSECDYVIIINPAYYIYLDESGNEIDGSDFGNLHAIIEQYFYFFGDAHVELDLGDNAINMDVKKGWYAWKMVDTDGDKTFAEICIDPIDNPHFAKLVTGDDGYSNCSCEAAKKLLDGIFETPQKSGFYLKDGKWKNVVEGRRM